MANHVLLNNVEHRNLKVIQDFSLSPEASQMCVAAFPAEARHAQAHYPLVFAKDGDGKYQMVALLGLEQGENLFLDNHRWRASYRPLVIERGPFLIGRSTTDGQEKLSIYVDMNDPRVVNEESNHSVDVFLPHGGNSEYIDNIANVLSTLHESQATHAEFVNLLEANKLIESFVVDIELDGSGTSRLSGFYTINEDVLKSLHSDALGELHQKGFLSTIYMMLASMSQLRTLVALKKERA